MREDDVILDEDEEREGRFGVRLMRSIYPSLNSSVCLSLPVWMGDGRSHLLPAPPISPLPTPISPSAHDPPGLTGRAQREFSRQQSRHSQSGLAPRPTLDVFCGVALLIPIARAKRAPVAADAIVSPMTRSGHLGPTAARRAIVFHNRIGSSISCRRCQSPTFARSCPLSPTFAHGISAAKANHISRTKLVRFPPEADRLERARHKTPRGRLSTL